MLKMVKPKNWRQINAHRRQLYYDSIDDINEVFDKLAGQLLKRVESARLEMHEKLKKHAELYKEK